ncbi:MAG: primosomal protein N' (replication factor Y) - superfamily II helicase [Rhodobacteraceae bacterium]|nr:primosomal protein N' (replication factor Y) - superfamily II helicase [Paracoccaceae bacterium]
MPPGEHKFPCASCGADLRFAPGTKTLVCEHCGAANDVPEGAAASTDHLRENDYELAISGGLSALIEEETRFSRCDNCGAEIEFTDEVHATECAFCAAPLVTGTGSHRRIKPAALLPFQLDERQAKKAMADWLGRLWFAPNGLQEYARKGRALNGIYTPFWTYDADTKSRYKGQRGDAYYETRTVTVQEDGKSVQRTEQVRKIRWSPRAGRVARFFDDILVLAATSLPKSYTDALEPWDLSLLEPYRPAYLAGFRAESYTITLEQGYAEARSIMDRQIDRDVRTDIGGDEQRVDRIDTTVSDITFKHVLLPIWTAAYKYRGKTYRFVVNGQSGAVKGERPWSWIKITLAVIAGLILAGVIGYFASQNG